MGSQSSKGSELCISAYMYILIQASSQIKNHSSLEIWRALNFGFILRVPKFTQFCSGFQCGKSSYDGHLDIWWPYTRLFWYISWESNNGTEVEHFDVLKRYELYYYRLLGYDTVKFVTRTQSEGPHNLQKSHPGRQSLAICHAKYRILK